jgi:hypothetical protein
VFGSGSGNGTAEPAVDVKSLHGKNSLFDVPFARQNNQCPFGGCLKLWVARTSPPRNGAARCKPKRPPCEV